MRALVVLLSLVPLTLQLCEEVMANCFVNQSYDPRRNGTCPAKIFAFHELGFERENLLRGFRVDRTAARMVATSRARSRTLCAWPRSMAWT